MQLFKYTNISNSICSSEAVVKQKKVISHSIPLEFIASDVLDHYRTYALIEKLLYTPQKLDQTGSFQLEKQSRIVLIEKYYSLDDYVCRELLGKKLSSKYRKDLDEISERTNIRLKSCRRQFDNIKRIQKAIEEAQSGSIIKSIQREFLLSEELAQKYCAIVFIAGQRFETTKKKLQYLNFMDFYECSQAIMNSWTYSYHQQSVEIEEEMDKEFLLDLRELRCLFDKEKEIKQ